MNPNLDPNSAALALVDPGLSDFAAKLRKLLPNGAKLSDDEALAGAQYAKTTGLDPFRGEFYVVPGVGVVPGYKGALARQGMQGREPDYRYRPLTEDERDWHDVQPGDKAVICEATDPQEAVDARRAGRQPRIWIGVGIVRKAEQWVSYEWAEAASGKRYKRTLPENRWTQRADPPTGRSWGWVAQNRAMKDCANHMGLPVELEATEILAQAEAAGIELDVPENAKLSAEQAKAYVAAVMTTHAHNVVFDQMTPEERQAMLAANVTTMRGPKSDDPLGIDEPPTGPDIVEGEIVEPPDPRAAILDRLRRQAQEQPAPADERLIAIANGHLRCLVNGDDAKRKALLAEVYGLESSKQLTTGQANTLIAWIAAKPQGRDENGKGVDFVPTGPALAAGEYRLLFPPAPELFDDMPA